MARPTTPHDGFLIPNAKEVTDPVLAEPDKIDFNTLANTRWGVIEGCAVNESGPTGVQVSPGTAIVNGALVTVPMTPLSLSTPDTNSQFNLVVVDSGGVVKLKQGDALLDPVFPEPAVNETVLASVYCASSQPDFRNNIIDKRKLLSTSLLTKIPASAQLIRNVNGTGNHFLMTGDGKMTWEGDASLERLSAEKLHVTKHLEVNGDLNVQDDLNAVGHMHSDLGYVSGINLRQGSSLPVTGESTGQLFQNTATGSLFVWRGGQWVELVVAVPGEGDEAAPSAIPTGTVITSLETPAKMRPLGWFPLDGIEMVQETVNPGLFQIAALVPYMTGTHGTRTMTLPNLNKRVLLVDNSNAGKRLGAWTNNNVVLTINHMPAHDHDIGVQSGTNRVTSTLAGHTHNAWIGGGQDGAHSHTISGGLHGHDINDPTHRHSGLNQNGVATTFIGVDEDGQNKLDALFNDRSHTFSVTPRWHAMHAATGITVKPSSTHSHNVSGGAHAHVIGLDQSAPHEHTIHFLSQGTSTPFSITPEHFTVYAYVRS